MALEVHWVSLYRFPGEEKQFFVELECFVWPEEDNERAKKIPSVCTVSFKIIPRKYTMPLKRLTSLAFTVFPFPNFFFSFKRKKESLCLATKPMCIHLLCVELKVWPRCPGHLKSNPVLVHTLEFKWGTGATSTRAVTSIRWCGVYKILSFSFVVVPKYPLLGFFLSSYSWRRAQVFFFGVERL